MGALRLGKPLAALALLVACAPALAARDVILVLDNSGSMRHNDPQRLAAPAVLEFIEAQPPDTRVGIVLFSADAELLMPLTPAEIAADGEAAAVLARFSYRGQWTQTAAGVERALYELRNEGRTGAARAVVLMTDGLIDTGQAARDVELHQWLRQDLAQQAAKEGIRVFGVAFTERADYQLLQSLAATTGAEYFRVLTADGIARALQRIEAVLAAAPPPSPGAAPVETPPPVVPSTPAPEPAPPRRLLEPLAWLWWVLAGAGVLVALAAALIWVSRGPRFGAGSLARRPSGPFGALYDSTERHELGEKPVVIGRAGGNDPTRHYIVLPEKTIGRWHATIERRGQTFWIRDEGSVNGTFVNGERVVGERPLKHRDTVRIHTHQFEFEIPELADADRTMLTPAHRLP